jgi:hypothetical protein
MIGYAEAVIERQDRYDVLKKTESFEIETSARTVLKELTDYYTKTAFKTTNRVEGVRNIVTGLNKRIDD